MDTLLHVHGGNLRAAAAKYGIDSGKLIDFSANINPLGPSSKAVQAIRENLAQIVHYPDPDCTEVVSALAEYLDLPVDNIVMGNGAVELIYILMHLIKPKKALIPAPTFGEYTSAVIAAGGEISSLPLTREENFALSTDKVIKHMEEEGTDVVFICNPNNPTGVLTHKEEIEKILNVAVGKGIWVIVDEAFIDFRPERNNYSVADMVQQYDNLFVLYSLTKFHAIPGLRLGAGLAGKGIIKKIKDAKDPWNVNCLAQVAGAASLRDKEYLAATVELLLTEQRFLYGEIEKIPGMVPFRPSANYIFIDVRNTGLTSGMITEELGQRGILVRDCSSYSNLDSNYIRIAIKNRQDNQTLLKALNQVLSKILPEREKFNE